MPAAGKRGSGFKVRIKPNAQMKPAFTAVCRLALALCLLGSLSNTARAQGAATSPTPLDARAQERALKEAKRAAEKESAELKAAVEKERKEAVNAAQKRARATPAQQKPAELPAARPVPEVQSPEIESARKAEAKAQAEAEKARRKEEDRIRAEDAREAERRRKDEERAEREAEKAREREEKARAEAERKEAQEAAKSSGADKDAGRERTEPTARTAERTAGTAARPDPAIQGDDRKRRELVRQIERARAERDRLNQKAAEAEQLAKAARAAVLESQRALEALTTGLDLEDVTPTPASPAEPVAKKSRFVTKADVIQTAAPKDPKAAADPLRVALDLKKPLPEERERAAFALASLGPEAQPATRALMAALADTSAAVRTAAAQALGRIGPGAATAIAPLSAALSDPDPAVKNAAQAALIAIQGR